MIQLREKLTARGKKNKYKNWTDNLENVKSYSAIFSKNLYKPDLQNRNPVIKKEDIILTWR